MICPHPTKADSIPTTKGKSGLEGLGATEAIPVAHLGYK
jgi:hypothetical protein